MSAVPSPAHVKAWRTRRAGQRTFIRFMAAQIEAELEGRTPPNKRRRFFRDTRPLLLTERVEPTPAQEVREGLGYPLLMAALCVLLLWSIFGTDFWVNDGKDRSVTRILFPTQIARTAP